ncbi:hypothetical protein PMAYCL1PPCAC_24975, partial [Pristionchus mayeri]
VLKQAEKYLTKTTGLDEMKKLIFADQYRLGSLRCLVKESERYLIQSKGIDVMKKLLLADQYRLENLKVSYYCLTMVDAPNTFEAPTEFTNVVLIIEGKKLHVNKDDACEQSEKFLMKTEKVNMKKKMEFAAQYNLEKLMV